MDSLRADHLSSYGYRSVTRPDQPTSPELDRQLVDQGTLFEHALSTTSWTLPAHMSLFTGKPNELHDVRRPPNKLHGSHTLLAEVFRGAGWRTAGFWSGPFLHPIFGFDRGFEVYEDCSAAPLEDPTVFDFKGMQDFKAVQDVHEASHEGVTGPRVVAAFERWFGTLDEDERFFAFLHLWDVHYDYEPPPDFDVFYPGYEGPIDGRGFTELRIPVPVDPADYNRLLALYDAEILFTDHNLARVLRLLEARAREANTLVVFTSDHGEEFLEHGTLGHRTTLYEEAVRIPLVLRLPGVVPAGLRVPDLVGLMDVAPTLLDLCNLPVPGEMWGRSLRPAFTGELEPRLVPMELTYPLKGEQLRALHGGDHKILRFPGMVKAQVFDLTADPDEREPRFSSRAKPDPRVGAADRFWKELDRLVERAATAEEVEHPDALLDELEKFGYLEGEEGGR